MAKFVPAVRGKIVEHLRAKGYFIGGILSRWLGEDALLIQKIRKRPNKEGINLHTERARRIQAFVRGDHETTARVLFSI